MGKDDAAIKMRIRKEFMMEMQSKGKLPRPYSEALERKDEAYFGTGERIFSPGPGGMDSAMMGMLRESTKRVDQVARQYGYSLGATHMMNHFGNRQGGKTPSSAFVQGSPSGAAETTPVAARQRPSGAGPPDQVVSTTKLEVAAVKASSRVENSVADMLSKKEEERQALKALKARLKELEEEVIKERRAREAAEKHLAGLSTSQH